MKCCVKPPCEITRLAEVEENVTRRRSRESQSAVLPPISKEAKPEKAKDHHRPSGGFGGCFSNGSCIHPKAATAT